MAPRLPVAPEPDLPGDERQPCVLVVGLALEQLADASPPDAPADTSPAG